MRMKSLLIILSVLAGVAGIVLAVLAHPAFGTFRHVDKERLRQSPNYREGMFQNQEPTPQFTGQKGDKGSLKTIWRFLTATDTLRTPQEALKACKTDLQSLPAEKDWVVWFGHSSYLFTLGGKRFIVDPVLQPEYPASLMLKPFPGTDIYRPEDMPDIDVLVITHEHWDHMDYATLRDLRTRVKKVICPLGIADYLRYWKYTDSQIIETDWYEDVQIFESSHSPIRITCLPTRHFSNRLLGRGNQTLWASFMAEAGGRKVYIGGDGGYDKRFKEIRERFGAVDLAFLENGQYNDNWRYIHTTPEGLEQAITDLQARQVFTVHHDKYALAMHPWNEPDSIARSIAKKHHVHLLDAAIGEVREY